MPIDVPCVVMVKIAVTVVPAGMVHVPVFAATNMPTVRREPNVKEEAVRVAPLTVPVNSEVLLAAKALLSVVHATQAAMPVEGATEPAAQVVGHAELAGQAEPAGQAVGAVAYCGQ